MLTGSASGDLKPLTAIDLFAGAGGMTLGLKLAGFEIIGAIEINALAVETYKMNHSEVEVWERDIRDVEPSEVMDRLNLNEGDLTLLGGCPPCQGFSTLRTRNQALVVDDSRNELVLEFVRFARAMKPAAIMVENVPNLVKDQRFSRVLNELASLGYVADCNAVRVLDASDYGVPQRRKRMILLAGREDRLPFAEPCVDRVTVESAFAELPKVGQGTDPLHDYRVRRSDRIQALIRSVPKDGGGRSSIPAEQQLRCHQDFDGFRDVYGRMNWNRPAPTITGGCFNPSKGRFLHPEEDRAITLREAAVLQSFPKNYKFSLRRGRMAVADQIGNALPPEFIRRHAEHLVKHWERDQCL